MSGGRSFDADACFAWPTAEICAMSIEGAIDVAFRKEYQAAPDPMARRQEMIDGTRANVTSLRAAEGFGVDDIIDPRDTRRRLIDVLDRVPARRDNDAAEIPLHRAGVTRCTPTDECRNPIAACCGRCSTGAPGRRRTRCSPSSRRRARAGPTPRRCAPRAARRRALRETRRGAGRHGPVLAAQWPACAARLVRPELSRRRLRAGEHRLSRPPACACRSTNSGAR